MKMKCPICEAELESRGFSVREDGVTNYYYCSSCDCNYHYGVESWWIHIPVDKYREKLGGTTKKTSRKDSWEAIATEYQKIGVCPFCLSEVETRANTDKCPTRIEFRCLARCKNSFGEEWMWMSINSLKVLSAAEE